MSGPAIPPRAIDAAVKALIKAALLNNAGYLKGDEEAAAWVVLEAAEAAWPHQPPPATEGTTDGRT